MIKRMKFSKYVMTQTMQNSFSTKYRMYAKYKDPTTDTMEDVMRIRAATALAVIPATREKELLLLLSFHLTQSTKPRHCSSNSRLLSKSALHKGRFCVPWVQDGWQITIGRELLGSVQQSFDKQYLASSIVLNYGKITGWSRYGCPHKQPQHSAVTKPCTRYHITCCPYYSCKTSKFNFCLLSFLPCNPTLSTFEWKYQCNNCLHALHC